MRASAISGASAGSFVITLRTPSGSPASRSSSPMRSPADIGATSLGLSTTVLPAASAATTERVPRMTGAFHGENAATTPRGSRTARLRSPSCRVVSTSPRGAVIRAAASRSIVAARVTLNEAHNRVAPTSPAIRSAMSSRRCSIRSAALTKIARRVDRSAVAQLSNAAWAASTARLTSSTPAADTVAYICPVAGLMTGVVRPDCAPISLPSISSSRVMAMRAAPLPGRLLRRLDAGFVGPRGLTPCPRKTLGTTEPARAVVRRRPRGGQGPRGR